MLCTTLALEVCLLAAGPAALPGQQPEDWRQAVDRVRAMLADGRLDLASLTLSEVLARERDGEPRGTLLAWMAAIQHSRGDHRKAEQLCKRSLTELRSALGERTPAALHPLSLLAILYARTGRLERARKVAQEALSLGPGGEPSGLAVLSYTHGEVLRALGRVKEAEAAYRESLRLANAASGPNSSESALALNGLGLCLLDRGLPRDAIPHFEQASRITELRGLRVNRMYVQMNLAEALCAAGEPERALAFSNAALNDLQTAFGPEHENVGHALGVQARVLRALGRGKQAEAAALESRNIAAAHAARTVDYLELGKGR